MLNLVVYSSRKNQNKSQHESMYDDPKNVNNNSKFGLKNNASTPSFVLKKSEEILEQKRIKDFHNMIMTLNNEGDASFLVEEVDISRMPQEALRNGKVHMMRCPPELVDVSMQLYDRLRMPDSNHFLSIQGHKHKDK